MEMSVNILKKVLVKLGRRPGPETLVDSKTGCSKVMRPQGKAGETKSHHRRKSGQTPAAWRLELETSEEKERRGKKREDTAEGKATRAN